MTNFKFQVLFLMENLGYEPQENQVSRLSEFKTHPRKLYSAERVRKQGTTIENCLRQFRTPERLSSADTWYCSKCKTHRNCIKQLELFRAAPVIVFSFNRFKSHNVQFSEKMNDRIKFPIYGLDMTPHVEQGSTIEAVKQSEDGLIYDLHGVIAHYGTLDHGHYIAYAKNSVTGHWYEYNDSLVTRLDTDNLPFTLCDNAYVVFYKLRNFEEKALGKNPTSNDATLDYDHVRQVPLANNPLTASNIK